MRSKMKSKCNEISEDEQAGTVTVNGFTFYGSRADGRCPTCGEDDIYHERFDAYFCAHCNAWLEAGCSDPGCEYCADRPDRPLPVPPLGGQTRGQSDASSG